MQPLLSKNNPRIKELAELRKHPSPAAFLVEGYHMVEMALEAGLLDEVYALKDPKFKDIPFTQISEPVLTKLSSTKTPEGIIGLAHIRLGLEPSPKKILLLDRLQDPGNVGTLLRSALAFGANNIIFLNGTASPLKEKTLMASQGAIFKIHMANMSEEEALDYISSSSLPFIATCLKGATSLEETNLPSSFILGLGNEGQGMSEPLIHASTLKIKIPIRGIDSLNVASAGAIMLYLLSRRENHE